MDNTTKIEINLASSIVTDKPQESIAPILQAMLTSAGESIPKADPGFILNTGIERDGGITNLYVNQVNYTDIPASYFTSTLSNLLEVFPQSGAGQLATVKVNNKNIGTVSSIGVQSRIQTVLSDDIALTLTGTYLAMKMGTNSSGAVTITLTEYSASTNLQIGTNTRTSTWTNITNISSSLTSISFIRYNGMKFTDSQEYALRLGTNLIILQESNLTAVIPPVATSVLGSNTIYTTCQYTYNSTTYTIFAGAGGTVGSFDGSNYKTYNGSGTGTGPYANGTSLNYTNSQTIYTSAVYGNFVIFGCATGLIASYNYTTKTWYSYNSGSGITSNAGVVSTDTITALGVVGGILFVGGSAGKLGSFIGVSWTAYNAGPGLCDNATLIGAVQINGIATYTSTEGIDILVAGASGRIGSGRLIPAGSFTNNASAFVSSMGAFPTGEVVYGNGIYVAASYNNYIYSSPDGINWTARTSTVMVNTPRIAFDAALGFVILCSGSSTYWVSSDGINWSSYTNIPITNTYDIACTGTGYFVVTPNGSGTPYTWQGLAYSWFAAGTSLPTGGWFLSYNNGYFVAYKNGSTSCYYSPSGYTWTAGGTLTSSQLYIGSGGGSFIAYGNGTSASLSTNHGVSWSAITLSNSVGVANELAYCNGVFFISTNTPGTFNYSSNLGSTWSTKTISNPPGAGLAGAFIGYGPIGLVGVANNGSFIIPNNALTLAPYTTATTTLAPTNNGTVVSTDNILTATPYYDPVLQTNEIVFTSSAGKIGYVTSAGSWLNYNSIYGVSNNATAVSTDSINVVCVSGNNFIIGSSAGKVATYTGSAWLNYNAGGTTPYVNNATVIGTSAIWGLDIINGSLMVSGVGGSMNSISNTNTVTPSWTIGGSGVSTILQGFTDLFYLYIYRYELTSQTVAQTSPGITSYSSNYLIDIVGNSQGKVLIINTSALSGTVLSGQYAWPQISNGLTQHIVTTSGPLAGPTVSPYLVSGSAAYNIGIVGYTTFNSSSGYSNTEVFSSFLTLGAGTAVVANGTSWYRAAGFNYAEMAYTTTAGGANVYQVYAPQFVPTATDYNNSAAQQTNSPFLLDHYGKLTNGFGVSPINGQAFEIRYNVIDSGGAGLGSPGTQQYLSAAMINGATDNLGVILTNVGEIDNTYAPHITNDNTILYRYGGNFFIITLGQPTNYIQRITDRLYKINTLSPLNNYDDLTNTLQLGSMDYNGRTLITNTVVASGAPYAFDAQILGGFSNSIDMSPGRVLIGSGTIASISGYNIFTPIAYTIPFLTSSLNYGVIEYYGTGSALNYLCTTKNVLPLTQINDSNVVKPLWVSNATYVPTPIGETIYYRAFLQLGYSTLLLNQQYQNPYTGGYNDSDTYIIGNEIYGSFQPFTFYGQDYLFDGSYIWAVLYDSTGTIYQNRFRVQPANGLQFIAVSPIKVYFLSSLDNSLYVFDEGRNLTKEARLNEIDTITNGVYNVHDNSLLLNGITTSGNPNTYGSLIWIRDSVLTINPKTSAQVNLQFFDTTNGIIISNNTSSWQYTFNPLPTSTVVPLTIQTTYMGMEDNEKIKMKNFVATFYNKNAKIKNSKPITISMQSIIREEAQVYTSQPQIYTINPGDYNSLGYVMLRLQPQYQTVLGISFVISTQSKINLTNLTVEYVVDGQGMYAGSKSK